MEVPPPLLEGIKPSLGLILSAVCLSVWWYIRTAGLGTRIWGTYTAQYARMYTPSVMVVPGPGQSEIDR